VHNNAINRWDMIGLIASACCKAPPGTVGYWDNGVGVIKGCAEICQEALNDSKISKKGGGGVICYGTTKCACMFPEYGITPGQCPAYDAIVDKHEKGHFGDVTCDACTKLSRPPSDDPSKINDSECALRKQTSQDCDVALLGEKDSKCKAALQALKDDEDQWVTANCKSKTSP